jgi:2-methylfumaryl-CoA hydratase
MTGKSTAGNFFEDFRIGQQIRHAVPRTVTAGDVALHAALCGTRFAVQSSDAFAQSVGLPRAPLDALLVFHVVFGKTVPDISLNAVANLGYADCRFLAPVWPGDSLTARSEVIGLRQTSVGTSGIVHVRSTGTNQHGEDVVTFVRWVMVSKRDPAAPAPVPVVPELPARVPPEALAVPPGLDLAGYDHALAGSQAGFDAYAPGECIDHIDGMTIEEAEHQIATRLYQNTARGHFDERLQKAGRFGRRIVYGGHVMSLARALSFNGLANAVLVAAVNGGRHVGPARAGDTVYCWSRVLERVVLADHPGLGALRLRTIATRDLPCAGFPEPGGAEDGAILLDLDYWVLMPASAGARP